MSDMPATTTGNGPAHGLRPTLSTRKIVIMVVAAAAPLAALVGTVPLAFAIGDGPGVPAMFLFAGVTLLCFSVGYAAMSRRIVNAGGFYTYVSSGLGRPPAVGAGLVAVLSYNTATVGMVGTFAYFSRIVGDQAGLHLPWEGWAALSIAAMGVLGYRQIDFSARVLQILLVGEIGILVLLDIAVLVRHGGGALPATSFAPHTVLGTGAGVTAMFAFASYIGFESAALYGEESRNPRRSVPMATYISVLTITVFYAFTSWIAVGAVGPSHLRRTAKHDLGNLFFNLSDDYLDKSVTSVMAILLCTSLFAGVLALHNAANRYMYVLGRERVLPRWLDAIHPKRNAPHRASLVQTTLTVGLVTVFALAGLDPYTSLATSMLGVGTLGIVVLQAAAALSVVGFFRDRPDRHWWRTGLAPLISFAGLAFSVVLLVANFSVLTGTGNPVVHALPWLLVAATAGGVLYGLWIRSARPDRYAALARTEVRETAEPVRPAPPALTVVPTAPAAEEEPAARTGNP
ncbi:amino acid/polyamine/organocation transporter (APC superfamily) [Streptomyces puniciscabiei]|uniref:Amino acid/polyamine/organocation transporter (APC superfamily) n=2 Tax=Streptomyces puniciscabiei TaxID=164348 RepID=A0A542UH31_9ACTN|nr:amino acid/polyamine/organocation transporter (APC superfamily) [Streptomyces puniciscabiei]